VLSSIASAQKSQGSCELRMRDRATNSSRALAGPDRLYGYVARLQSVKPETACVASHRISGRSLLGEFLVVNIVSIILLCGSG